MLNFDIEPKNIAMTYNHWLFNLTITNAKYTSLISLIHF